VEQAAARIWSALHTTATDNTTHTTDTAAALSSASMTFKTAASDTSYSVGESPVLTVDSPQHKNDVVCLHIRRGDKLADTARYPQLAQETSPQSVLATLTPWAAAGSVLYIATDEPRASHFYELLQKRYRVSALDSFGWVVSAQQFLPSSLALVDYAVSNKCTKLINTFADEPARGFARSDISLSQSNK
jgi:hypothetical protein